MPPTPANLIWIMPAEGNGLESYITVMPSILIVDGYFFAQHKIVTRTKYGY